MWGCQNKVRKEKICLKRGEKPKKQIVTLRKFQVLQIPASWSNDLNAYAF